MGARIRPQTGCLFGVDWGGKITDGYRFAEGGDACQRLLQFDFHLSEFRRWRRRLDFQSTAKSSSECETMSESKGRCGYLSLALLGTLAGMHQRYLPRCRLERPPYWLVALFFVCFGALGRHLSERPSCVLLAPFCCVSCYACLEPSCTVSVQLHILCGKYLNQCQELIAVQG